MYYQISQRVRPRANISVGRVMSDRVGGGTRVNTGSFAGRKRTRHFGRLRNAH